MPSTIDESLQGKTIVVFGSTTFPGKVLLEKLLHSCPTIEKIFCPIRPVRTLANQYQSPVDTFAEIYATKLFDRVRRANGEFHEKILPFDINQLLSTNSVTSDTHNENDGNSRHRSSCVSHQLLQDTIDVCFYIANQSVNSNEYNLKDMMQHNVMDLKSSLNFLKTCTRLTSIVYLSSIYANIGKTLRT
jgi:hypothetical protein